MDENPFVRAFVALPAIQAALDGAMRPLPFFGYEAGGVGWFGGRRPRAIWAAVTAGAESDCRVADGVRAGVRAAGHPDDERAVFTPHITLGRLRPGSDPAPLLEFLEKRHTATPFGHSEASGILLQQSVLGSAGPAYTVLHESRFGGPPAA